MGIPYYFKKITDEIPNALHKASPQCTRLFLDFNCAIHHCHQQLKNIMYEPTMMALPLQEAYMRYEFMLIQAVLEYIRYITMACMPTKLLYISMDGLAPRAKIMQQRKRRFLGTFQKQMVHTEMLSVDRNFISREWDANAISPGTQFMKALAVAINEYCKRAYAGIEVIVSDTMFVGEGEHKIMIHISRTTNRDQESDVIYGLDADLIMLSMIHNESHKIYLMREPVFYDMGPNQVPFLYMDTNKLAQCISNKLHNYYGIHDTPNSKALDVYIFLCFMIGNDFLPNLSYLRLKENGLEELLHAYAQLRSPIISKSSQNGQYDLHIDVLQRLMFELAKTEDDSAMQIHSWYVHATPQIKQTKNMPQSSLIEQRIHMWPLIHKHPELLQQEAKGWRIHYYQHLFEASVDDICLNYVQGLYWLIDTYFHQDIQFGWYYKHMYSPSILDLSNFLISLSDINSVKNSVNSFRDIIDSTDLQLLCILPPASKHLLPAPYQQLYDRVELGCVHLFPYSFGVMGYLKKFLHECNPMLPPLDIALLKKAMQKCLV
jgi:5'-3' exoribonuclease 1